MEKVFFNYKGKKITVNVKECKGICRGIGLMFQGKQNANALLFSFNEPSRVKIHSFFVFFPFVAVWLDKNNKVVSLKKVKSFTLSIFPGESYHKLIEIPVNKKYSKIVKLLCS